MEMRTLAEMRVLLGDVAVGMTDAEVLQIREDTYNLARRLVAAYQATARPPSDLVRPPDRSLRRRPGRPKSLSRSA